MSVRGCRRLLALGLLALPAVAGATAMQSSPRKSLVVEFDNGDRAAVECGEVDCVLSLRVNGKTFRFTRDDLDGVDIYPDEVHLYSGYASGKDKYFSFSVSTSCPEEVTFDRYLCSTHGLVREGAPLQVSVHRDTTGYYKLDPAAPPEPAGWEFTLRASSKRQLEALVPALAAMGYTQRFDVDEVYRKDPRAPVEYSLTVHRDGDYTPALYAQRKREFAEFAATHGVTFEGVYVGHVLNLPSAQVTAEPNDP